MRAGARSLARLAANEAAWSDSDHSHSRLFRNPSCDGKVSLLRVVSMVKIRRCSASSRPWRSVEECRPECEGSMNEREFSMVWTLWWCRSDRYEPRPTGTDL